MEITKILVTKMKNKYEIVLQYIKDLSFEIEVLPLLAKNNKLGCYKHDGFWQPMDTLRDKKYLEKIWHKGDAAWRI